MNQLRLTALGFKLLGLESTFFYLGASKRTAFRGRSLNHLIIATDCSLWAIIGAGAGDRMNKTDTIPALTELTVEQKRE